MLYFKLYALAVPVFFAIDMLWLGLVARGFYVAQIGHLLKKPDWAAAVILFL
jgi:uncharacterized membrane protein